MYSRYCPTNILKKQMNLSLKKNCQFLTNKLMYTFALVKFWLQKETPNCFQNNVGAFHALNLLDLLSQQTFICSFQSTSLQRNIRKTLNPGKNFTEKSVLAIVFHFPFNEAQPLVLLYFSNTAAFVETVNKILFCNFSILQNWREA